MSSRTRIRPSPGMLLIEPLPEEDRTLAGLYLPVARDNSIFVGTVREINPPPDDDPVDYFKVGQRVIIGKWSGTEVSIRINATTSKYILVNEDSILATLEEEPDNVGDSSEGSLVYGA